MISWSGRHANETYLRRPTFRVTAPFPRLDIRPPSPSPLCLWTRKLSLSLQLIKRSSRRTQFFQPQLNSTTSQQCLERRVSVGWSSIMFPKLLSTFKKPGDPALFHWIRYIMLILTQRSSSVSTTLAPSINSTDVLTMLWTWGISSSEIEDFHLATMTWLSWPMLLRTVVLLSNLLAQISCTYVQYTAPWIRNVSNSFPAPGFSVARDWQQSGRFCVAVVFRSWR